MYASHLLHFVSGEPEQRQPRLPDRDPVGDGGRLQVRGHGEQL